jgi:serine/threonine protein phosphatase PrpC
MANVPNKPGWTLVGVFDGHGGSDASSYAAEKFLSTFLRRLEKDADSNRQPQSQSQLQQGGEDEVVEDAQWLANVLSTTFLDLDLRFARAVASGRAENAGTTAVMALITPLHIFIANAGDSRSFVLRDNRIAAVTKDHKPDDADERERIEEAGSVVTQKRIGGVPRIDGKLAVSRGLGDLQFKEAATSVDEEHSRTSSGIPTAMRSAPDTTAVTALPDIYLLDRTPQDQMVVLACDGVFDVLESREVAQLLVDLLQKRMEQMTQPPPAKRAKQQEQQEEQEQQEDEEEEQSERNDINMRHLADAVVREGYRRDSGDNLSCLVVGLPSVIAPH